MLRARRTSWREPMPGAAKGDSAAGRLPVEEYSAERKAEFLLSNAVDEVDYSWAVREVRKLGIDPDAVSHERPRAE